jgi:hypothetical protein
MVIHAIKHGQNPDASELKFELQQQFAYKAVRQICELLSPTNDNI